MKKIIFCSTLNKNVLATFYLQGVKNHNGDIRFKAVEFYNCECKKECNDNNIMDCSCFKEVKKIEMEANHMN